MIRLGTLKQICKELRMSENGKNTGDIKTALLQNASAFITANISYKSNDGAERKIDAGFTRYGIIFTGDTLPDGHKADAVYIVLNDPYRDVVNHAPTRPLDYDYLSELRPAPQRFYEIISYRVFAALRNNRNDARINYSEFCMFSAQQRYFDHEHFRVQMYKVHKPHLDAGYLSTFRHEPIRDAEGQADWALSTGSDRERARSSQRLRKGIRNSSFSSKTPKTQSNSLSRAGKRRRGKITPSWQN